MKGYANILVQKKKKTLLGRVIKKVGSVVSPCEKVVISAEVTLNDVRTNYSDIAFIEERRNELIAAKHDNSDLTITVDGGNSL